MRLLAAILITCLLALGPRPAVAAPTWEAGKTYALLIGILEWQDKDLASFPKKNRQDRELERTLKTRGVPADNIVFLADRQATLQAIRTALGTLAAKAGPGSTLLVYFAGHGLRANGQTYLANYDVNTDRTAATAFGVTELGDRLTRNWHGSRLLLMADCCHSGAVAEVVRRIGARGTAAACLTSATASNESTGNWTFTESVIRALQGDGRVDRNQDRRVTFAEADAHVHDEMKFAENQLTQGVRAGGFEADWQLTAVPAGQILPATATQGPWTVGSYAEALSEGKWYRAKILKAEPGRFRIHYTEFGDEWDEWVTPNRLRPIPRSRFAAGQPVEIKWEDKWYAGRILRSAEGYFHYIHYDGYGDGYDEWVTDQRLRPAKGG